MGVNASQFEKELLEDLDVIERKFIDFRADVVGDMLSHGAGLTPVGATKRTVRGWGAQVGNLRYAGEWRAQGSAVARAFLRRTRVGDPIFAGNSWFVSGFHENGTKRGLRAVHMLARAIEAVKDRKA